MTLQGKKYFLYVMCLCNGYITLLCKVLNSLSNNLSNTYLIKHPPANFQGRFHLVIQKYIFLKNLFLNVGPIKPQLIFPTKEVYFCLFYQTFVHKICKKLWCNHFSKRVYGSVNDLQRGTVLSFVKPTETQKLPINNLR